MKKVFFSLLFFFFCTILFAQTLQQKMDALVTAYAKEYNFNGTVLVAQKGNILFQKGYGYKNANQKLLNDENTIFQIGSITKQFTAAIILQLQQQNKLSVSDKVSKYFPAFPNGDRITIENLLTHTSGIYNYTNDTAFMGKEVEHPHTQEQMMALFKDKPLNFEPGSKWDYSNSGYSLLGYIIEKVTKKPYEQVVRERILGPLQMNSSGFDFTHLQGANKAIGYSSLDAKTAVLSKIVDSTVAYSAGSLYTTVGDLYKWDRAIYTNKILTPGSWKKAFTPFKEKYGYGWFIDSMFNKPIVTHGGGIHGFTSNILRFPQDQLVVVVLDNTGSSYLSTISKSLAAIAFNQSYELPKERKEVKVDDTLLQQYVGEYQLAPTFIIKVTSEDGGLKVQATGQPTVDLFAESENKFYLKVIDADIEFVKDNKGKVEKLVLDQGGKKQEAKKIK